MPSTKYSSFYFHYNKPASNKHGHPIISIHINGKCFLAKNLVVKVPTRGRLRTKQPRFVMTGKCKQFILNTDGIGTLL